MSIVIARDQGVAGSQNKMDKDCKRVFCTLPRSMLVYYLWQVLFIVQVYNLAAVEN